MFIAIWLSNIFLVWLSHSATWFQGFEPKELLGSWEFQSMQKICLNNYLVCVKKKSFGFPTSFGALPFENNSKISMSLTFLSSYPLTCPFPPLDRTATMHISESLSQFHQNFMSSFFVPKWFPKLFCIYSLIALFHTKKLFLKWWWNWHL